MFSVVEYSKKKKSNKLVGAVFKTPLATQSYEDFLASRRPIKLVNDKYSAVQGGKVKKNILRYIPPLNTDIRVSAVLPPAPQDMKVSAAQLPTSWDSRNKFNVMPALNQGLCGSCWSMASAAVVSDVFAATNGTSNPNLSPTYILSNYGQGICEGGNPAQAIKDMSSKGISNTNCLDYNWCLGNDNCSGNATGHFTADPTSLNSLIPKPSKSCYKAGPYQLYYVDSPVSLSANNPSQVPNIINRAKAHIMANSSIIGTYHVLNNFLSGDYSSTNDIYIESNSYGTSDPTTEVGNHAIRIIGWGESQVENEGLVGYWLCMNSWSPNWGKDGTFKIAQYPVNKISQMEFASTTNEGDTLGGMILVKSGSIVTKNLNQITNPPPTTFAISKKTGMTLLYIFGPIIGIIIVIFLYKKFLKKKK